MKLTTWQRAKIVWTRITKARPIGSLLCPLPCLVGAITVAFCRDPKEPFDSAFVFAISGVLGLAGVAGILMAIPITTLEALSVATRDVVVLGSMAYAIFSAAYMAHRLSDDLRAAKRSLDMEDLSTEGLQTLINTCCQALKPYLPGAFNIPDVSQLHGEARETLWSMLMEVDAQFGVYGMENLSEKLQARADKLLQGLNAATAAIEQQHRIQLQEIRVLQRIEAQTHG